MAYSKSIKDQSASAKRLATSIDKILVDLDNQSLTNKQVAINSLERATLVKAATILRHIGSEKAKAAKTEKNKELQREKQIAQAKVAAAKLIANWPAPKTNLDKVSLIGSSSSSYSIERYLEEGLPIWNRDVVADDWIKMLDELFADALKDIADTAAYRSVSIDTPIEEAMIKAAEKIETIKMNPKARNLADKWAAKMNP